MPFDIGAKEEAEEVGLHYDDGKPRIDLIDPDFIVGLGDILYYGANKYGDRNWQKGIAASRLYGSVQRHLNYFWGGEEVDDESGREHLLHAACNIMMLYWMLNHKAEYDDRGNS